MVRKVKVVGDDRDPKTPAVPTTKPKGKKGATFRTPHPGLEVIVVHSERTDMGAGSYSIKPPETVQFENRGSYGEATVDDEIAKILREIAKDRIDRMLFPKFVEV